MTDNDIDQIFLSVGVDPEVIKNFLFESLALAVIKRERNYDRAIDVTALINN